MALSSSGRFVHQPSLKKPTSSYEATLLKNNKITEHVKKSPISKRAAREVFLGHSQQTVLVTNSASRIDTVKHKPVEKYKQMVPVTYGVKYTLMIQLFHNLVLDFSTKAMQLPERIVVAYATTPPKAVMTPKPSPHQQSPMGTPEKVNKSVGSKADFAESDSTTADRE